MDSFNPYAVGSVSESSTETRNSFIRKTYWHLAAAVAAFAAIEALLIRIVPAETVFNLLAVSKYSWLVVLAAFMGVSWIAGKWANSGASPATQYAGLALFVVAEAVIFLPLIMIASAMENGVIVKAAAATLGMLLGLTAIAFSTRKDFSFLGGFVKIACLVVLVAIVASFFIPGLASGFGFWLSIVMVLVMSASILYNTSNIMYHYAVGQHVGAALSLFASVATMFWHVLRLFMSRD